MSDILSISPKHCGAKRGHNLINRNLLKKLWCLFSALLSTLLAIILAAWLILRPSTPEFSLRQADVYQLNLSSAPPLLNSSLQVTLLSHNPNSKLSILYDRLRLYASYEGQQITLATSLPPFYQGRQDTNVLTASLSGAGLPVDPSFGYQVLRDKTAGKLVLDLKAYGTLRWKVGTWVSGSYRFFVNCVAVMPFGPVVPSGPLSVKHGTQCSTEV